jgi:peptidoglycan-associated lipoprotein
MRLTKFVALFVVGLALAACETASSGDTGSSAGGAGGPIRPGSQEDLAVNVGDRVFFGFDRSDLSPEGQATLQKQAAWLKTYSSVSITIEGHCDERGTREYNLALGDRRATSVKNYLVALGIPANRMTTISYGKERPAELGSNEAAWAKNRRGVTVVN